MNLQQFTKRCWYSVTIHSNMKILNLFFFLFYTVSISRLYCSLHLSLSSTVPSSVSLIDCSLHLSSSCKHRLSFHLICVLPMPGAPANSVILQRGTPPPSSSSNCNASESLFNTCTPETRLTDDVRLYVLQKGFGGRRLEVGAWGRETEG